ncbi:hypothetical protein V1264_016688 [Littorina saxatilis]|uniref:MADF domain-containing protein n=1 Tax=Littorina saxatilis TaxID=31220 RepID=A0AAN9BHG4_9CAEN
MADNTGQRLSSEQVGYLIELYHGHEALWNAKSKSYRNRDIKDASYRSIQTNFMEKFGVQLTVDTIRKKITNIRTSFVRELTKVNTSRTSGAGADDVYVPSNEHFEQLIFLKPVVTFRKSLTNLIILVSLPLF